MLPASLQAAPGLTQCLDSLSVDINTDSAEKWPLAELSCTSPPSQTVPGEENSFPLAEGELMLFYVLVGARESSSGAGMQGQVCVALANPSHLLGVGDLGLWRIPSAKQISGAGCRHL